VHQGEGRGAGMRSVGQEMAAMASMMRSLTI
jgi:hypothetical protein